MSFLLYQKFDRIGKSPGGAQMLLVTVKFVVLKVGDFPRELPDWDARARIVSNFNPILYAFPILFEFFFDFNYIRCHIHTFITITAIYHYSVMICIYAIILEVI